ncbi:ComEA family DNA-binding protein [Agreia sp. VKM Ac-1783]|uniref:ComEA family DNA-binding protein n=1 Tax=Agreia sp. VKM Ac-1783 TaxID=1938889 RepID=UPI000A2AC183|nr:ComEA family DNA-binding protein [Agreia sp. VKM Ac-1783]SMQ63653.1 competence protein ComEA [Agreia sp. VKM Ac-1783]
MDAGPQPPARARLSIGVGAGIVIVLAVLVVAVLVSALAPRGSSEVLVTNPDAAQSDSPLDEAGATAGDGDARDAPVIYVHVLGSVARPGLYQLREGARIVDAIAAAGGYTDVADTAQLNLARVVTDGEQLYAPAVGEAPPLPATGGAAMPGDPASTTVNLNTADSAALETLPRIGPETAKKIIDYRDEHGPFTSIDQLLEVPGIGQKTLDGLRDAAVV